MSLSSAKAKLDAQGGDPVTGYISKTDHQESYDELVDDTALTGATTAEAITVSGAAVAGTLNGRDPDDLVKGPASATDNALVRFDGTGGKTVQNSGITVDDSGNVSSDLTISKATAQLKVTATSAAPLLSVRGNAGQERTIDLRTDASRRWRIVADNAAESGSNAGSDFAIQSYDDSSAFIANVIYGKRSTGRVTLGGVGATAGLELGASGPRVMSGTGSPEGVVTAPVGSRWIRTDGDTLGDFEYQKRSGTGNTGWVVAEGDTGSRNMSAVSLDNGWTVASSVFQLRRIGATVQVTVGVNKTSATADTFYTLPVGFRPAIHTYGTSSSATDDYANATFTTGGGLAVSRAYMTATAHYLAVTFVTGDAWPTSLPGSVL